MTTLRLPLALLLRLLRGRLRGRRGLRRDFRPLLLALAVALLSGPLRLLLRGGCDGLDDEAALDLVDADRHALLPCLLRRHQAEGRGLALEVAALGQPVDAAVEDG